MRADDRCARVLTHDETRERRRPQVGDRPGRDEARVGGDGSAGRQRDAEAADGRAVGQAKERVALVLGEDRRRLRWMVGQPGADRGQRRPARWQGTARDERLREAPVWSAIRPGVAHADDAPIRQPETARPLHVQQEERNRVVGPGELQAAAGERAGIDLGARRVRDEPPAVEASGEAAAAARGIDRVRVDVDQIGRADGETSRRV